MTGLTFLEWLIVFLLFFEAANLLLRLHGKIRFPRRQRKSEPKMTEEMVEETETVEQEEEEPEDEVWPLLREIAGGEEG